MITKHVKFDGDLQTRFDPELIDKMQVKQLLAYNWENSDLFEPCEHLGWNAEGENGSPYFDYGCIGQCLCFEVYNDKCKLIATSVEIGFEIQDEPTLLLIDYLSSTQMMPIKQLSAELIFPRPTTMEEFAIFTNEFLCHIMELFEKESKEHSARFIEPGSIPSDFEPDISILDSDLPF